MAAAAIAAVLALGVYACPAGAAGGEGEDVQTETAQTEVQEQALSGEGEDVQTETAQTEVQEQTLSGEGEDVQTEAAQTEVIPEEADPETPEEWVLRVNDRYYTAAEYAYCYDNTIRQFLEAANGYESMLGLDMNTPLDEQSCTISETDQTWADYFADQTSLMLERMAVTVQDAKKSGFADREDVSRTAEEAAEAVSDGDEATDAEADTDADEATDAEADTNAADATATGSIRTEEDDTSIRLLAWEASVGEQYQKAKLEETDLTEEELEEYFLAHESDFVDYSYLLAFVRGEGYDGKSASECVTDLEQADTEETFCTLTKQLTGQDPSAIYDITAAEMGNPDAPDVRWLLDAARKGGDTWTGENGDDFFVLYFLERDDHGFGGKDGDWEELARTQAASRQLEEWVQEQLSQAQIEEGTGMDQFR